MSGCQSRLRRLENIARQLEKRTARFVPLFPPPNSTDAEVSALKKKHLRENSGDRDEDLVIVRTIYEEKPDAAGAALPLRLKETPGADPQG
jgi:hypothetical protein